MGETRNKAALRGKITLRGTLHLESPLRIGSGEQGSKEADIYVLKDKENRPFIPGSSLAGVLRSAFGDTELTALVFGSEHLGSGDEQQILQSSLAVQDVILSQAEIILRDNVRIDADTGTAVRGAKFNYEAVSAGAEGELFLTLTIREFQAEKITALQEAADNLARSLTMGISLGSLTSKGFGRAYCREIKICRYDFTNPEAVQAYLKGMSFDEISICRQNREYSPKDFVIEAKFSLNGSLLIRQIPNEAVGEMQLVSEQMKGKNSEGKPCFVIPGTSVKGVLRHQAEKILRYFDEERAEGKLNSLMGSPAEQKSRFIVEEVYIDKELVRQEFQTRNKIDRFTGGTISGHLFTEKPIWQISPWQDNGEGKPWRREKVPAVLEIRYHIKDCAPWEAGLALFLLRDLSLGRIALGGGKAVGRGTLTGCSANIYFDNMTWMLDGNGKVQGDRAEELAEKLHEYGLAMMED